MFFQGVILKPLSAVTGSGRYVEVIDNRTSGASFSIQQQKKDFFPSLHWSGMYRSRYRWVNFPALHSLVRLLRFIRNEKFKYHEFD